MLTVCFTVSRTHQSPGLPRSPVHPPCMADPPLDDALACVWAWANLSPLSCEPPRREPFYGEQSHSVGCAYHVGPHSVPRKTRKIRKIRGYCTAQHAVPQRFSHARREAASTAARRS